MSIVPIDLDDTLGILSVAGVASLEAAEARAKFGPMHSAHEAYAILLEEVDELWEHVKVNQTKRDLEAMQKEAMQVAAVALRFAAECCNETVGRR